MSPRPQPSALQLYLVCVAAASLVVSLWEPPYPRYQLLQHLFTVPALAALAFGSRRGALSTPSFLALWTLLELHILGARWTYSFVPYDAWARDVLGWEPRARFGWTRNHYDRFVHLAFGLLFVAPCAELIQRRSRLGRRGAALVSFAVVLSLSGAYEVFEWALTSIVAPDQAETYNGQQGDLFDAQKDMALAAAGALLATALRVALPQAAARQRTIGGAT